MKVRAIIKLAAAVGCSLVATNASWAGLTEIYVKAYTDGFNGVTSRAWDGTTQVGYSTWAGAWTADIQSGDTWGSPDPFLAFCTDIGNTMPDGTYTYEARKLSPVGDTPEGSPPDPNWADGVNSGLRAGYVYNTYKSQVTTKETRAAMALAIWEVLYQGGTVFDITAESGTTGHRFAATGNFLGQASGVGSLTVAQLANSWLRFDEGFGFNTTWWAEMESPDVQSLIGPPSAVPEPTTVIAGALLLLPFGMSTLRALRKKR